MAEVPADLVADLRNQRSWPDLMDSLWRSPALVELSYGRLWHLVAEVLPAAPARVLDVGCGTGALRGEARPVRHFPDHSPFPRLR